MPKKTRTRRIIRRYRRSRRASVATHAMLPVALGSGALAAFLLGNAANGDSLVRRAGIIASGDMGGADNLGGVLASQFEANLPAIVGLATGALAFGWAGKKFGLHRTTRVTRKWSVL